MSDLIKNLEKLVEKGYVSKRAHSLFPLWIWNYTPRCAFEGKWNKFSMQARGLITNAEGIIVSRPFEKFFNLDQITESYKNHVWHWYKMKYKEFWTRPFKAYEKMDGSLGISYHYNGAWGVATRGSFESDQAKHATDLLNSKYAHIIPSLDKDFTYLFEIIYKDNRIVIDYGDSDELVLLSVIKTSTGEEFDVDLPFRKPKGYDYTKVEELVAHNEDNFEGFVLRFDNGVRCKVKLAEYCRLHRIMTGINENTVLDNLINEVDFNEWLKDVPDEFYKEITSVKQDYLDHYKSIESFARNEYSLIENLTKSRKEFAEQAFKSKYSSILFAMADKKDYSRNIWTIIKNRKEKM